MIITRATEYAIRALLFMAKQPRGEIVLKKDICRTQEVTPAFLTKILQPLIKEGIVGSQRGVGGGFYLLKAPAEVTLLDVVKAEEGPLYLNQCLAHDGFCDRDVFCPMHGAWREVQDEIMAILDRYNFAHLARQETLNLGALAEKGKMSKKDTPAE
ncbi:Rrf2 family transcriptional regulator [uncultured Desulfuromonas sp.]|uniref:RrF2 family transcriptional regulator n=1 Tax=uncultured Desulfuromonas sp. TaxID=181013 RepID=UPI00262FB75A|nr:Rrf2 family transcriptional regulator [uncultured Desulfuromonas sp.]